MHVIWELPTRDTPFHAFRACVQEGDANYNMNEFVLLIFGMMLFEHLHAPNGEFASHRGIRATFACECNVCVVLRCLLEVPCAPVSKPGFIKK